jgi:ABC-type amino acid transport substrate-binding protein
MTAPAASPPLPPLPPDVRAFADEKGVAPYLPAVIGLARRAFASSALVVALGQDAEDESHQYIALDVDVANLSAEELLARQRVWSADLFTVCPPPAAVHFVLGWR